MITALVLAAATYGPVEEEQIRRETTRWQIAYTVLSAIDAVQTIECVKRPDCYELNPLYGRKPSAGRVIAVKLTTGALHWLLMGRLKQDNPKAALRVAKVTVFIQGGVVAANMRMAF